MEKNKNEYKVELRVILFIFFIIGLLFLGTLYGIQYLVDSKNEFWEDFKNIGLNIFVFIITGVVSTFFFKYLISRSTPVNDLNQKLEYLFKFKFKEKTVDSFLRSIDFNKVNTIEIIAHTGENIVTSLLQIVAENVSLNWTDKNIKILLRSPEFEIGKRAKGISRTVDKINELSDKLDMNIYYKYYSSLPMFRTINLTCENDYDDICFLSFYYFPTNSPSKRFDKSLIIDNPKANINNELVQISSTWFNQMWGKDNNVFKHTIVLDFDDTIVSSHKLQIKAWNKLIEEEIDLNIRNNADKISLKIKETGKDREQKIEKIFFKKQNAKEIFHELFDVYDCEIIEKLEKTRFNIRKSLMSEEPPELFDGVKETLEKLSKKYNLIIVSATDEDMIMKYLENKGLKKYFWYVFGKREPVFNWNDFERKANLLWKIVQLTGVPIERMTYIGDNNGDFLASKRINIDFIEARLFGDYIKKLLGIKNGSLIQGNQRNEYFTKWKSLMEKF